MAFPPQAFIIGAQKAATTSLADLLAQHPGIEVSNPKEPDFFNVNWERGLDWYRSRFARTDAVLLDASVSYTMASTREWERGTEFEVPERIHSLCPNARFIYIVRDPADRCYSAYWHEKRAGREKSTLRNAVERKAYYTMASYYHLQINRFLRFFPLERFHIVQFEEAVRDPVSVAQNCSDFLEAGHADFSFTRERQKNQGFQYNFAGEALRGLSGISRFVPEALKPLAKRMLTKNLPDLAPEDHAWMTNHFQEDALAFEKLTGVRVLSGSR
ncbi:MAG TPA: sulfotransferase [Rhizomicrobium sp.]|nr:sulfotransferase [Rhizomicrobium sp.]